MDFGEKLKKLRYEKRLTQDDLGYLFGVTKSCICCYENGTRKPSLDILIKVSSYFRVSVDYLICTDPFKNFKKINYTKNDKYLIDIIKNNPDIYQKMIDNPKKSIMKIKEMFQKQEE